METVSLGEFMEGYCDEAGYDNERLICEAPGDEITVRADPALLSRLLQNLVENAFKYGRTDGHVWLSASKEGGEALLKVRDDGVGIPPEHQEKIWQRFYQADPSRSGEGGAGLGLSLVKQIAQAHGGYMTLESVRDIGSCFTLHLPCYEKSGGEERKSEISC